MLDILSVLNDQLTGLGLNYEFGEMTQSPPIHPYWVGEYSETDPGLGDGQESPVILLTGFTRGSRLTLETQKEIIRDHFKHGVTVMTPSKTSVSIFYSGSLPVPTDDIELKKIQVNLQIKSWKGN